MKPSWRGTGLLTAVVLVVLFWAGASAFGAESKKSSTPAKKSSWGKPAKFVEPAIEAPEGLPPAEITVGGRAGDGVAEGFGDVLVPVLMLRSGVVFVNPRATLSDNDEEEYNIGVGIRQLLPNRNIILGANLYYDYRETELGSQFGQLGVGLEMLGSWVDARANYYLPEDERETVNEFDQETVSGSSSSRTEWGDIHAAGHSILQDGLQVTRVSTTVTRQHFEQYEQAMEGYDLEFGVRLPIPVVDDYCDVKVFGGYYGFNAKFGAKDIEGFKGRLEIRAVSSVYLDAEWYEDDELNGSDYYVGARVSVPFDVANLARGHSPFEGAGWKEPPFPSRLTDMVMRDLHVRTEVSPITEIVEERQSETTSTTTEEPVTSVLVDNVTFVDKDNAGGTENGTAERPYDSVQEGADDPRDLVYIRDAATAYDENVVVGGGVTLWGSGCPLDAGGQSYGSGVYPVVDGVNPGPTIRITGDGVTIRGLSLRHSDPTVGVFLCPVTGRDITRAGVAGCNVTDIEIRCNEIGNVSDGIVLTGNTVEDFRIRLNNNTVVGAVADGVYVSGRGLSGTFDVDISGEYSGNGQNGVQVIADNYDSIVMNLHDLIANGNGDMGVWVLGYTYSVNADIDVDLEGIEAGGNQGLSWGGSMGEGVAAELRATGAGADVALTLRDSTLNGNSARGADVNLYAGAGVSSLYVEGVEASGNRVDGLYARVEALDSGGTAYAQLNDVTALGNSNGVHVYRVYSPNGDATAIFDGIQANGNTGRGILIEQYGAFAGGPGADAILTMNNVRASTNGVEGIFFPQYGAYANGANGDARFSMQDVEASDNGGSGVYVYWYAAYANDGAAEASFDTVTADGNTGDGLHLDGEAAYSQDDASVHFGDVRANGNDGSGIFMYYSGANSWNGSADASFERVETSGNGAYGIFVDDYAARAGGIGATATVSFAEVRANGNGLDGIHVDDAAARADAVGGAALLTLRDVEASGNGADGLFVNNVFALSGGAGVIGERIRAVTNGNDGVQFVTTSAPGYAYDFGGAGQSAGNSSIYGNAARDFNNTGPGTVSAESNWWGSATPVAGQFQGTVDYDPWLTVEPPP